MPSKCATLGAVPAGAAVPGARPGSRIGRGVPDSTTKKSPFEVAVLFSSSAASRVKAPVPEIAVTFAVTRIPSYRSSCSRLPAGEMSSLFKRTGSGSACPLESTFTLGDVSSVTVGALGAVVTSLTVPATRTKSPRATNDGGKPVTTTRPSDELGSPSPGPSVWM